MKTDFDLNTTLFQTLNGNVALKSALTGGVYKRQRPLNSTKEDVVINTIAVSMTSTPQQARSNVNIYVKDLDVVIDGLAQKQPNDARMKALADLAITAIKGIKIDGISVFVSQMGNFEERDIYQHFVNLRVDWHIHTKS
ncbi:hypothetical protein [Leadbetterella byssophila]|uniref:hypothetical protein n=1 Tax=Leadbetterella byssophila TaxID=316068 RepID=UPI0039A1F0DB